MDPDAKSFFKELLLPYAPLAGFVLPILFALLVDAWARRGRRRSATGPQPDVRRR